MRYVDLTQLERPPGWDDRARSALEALRSEVSAAEAAAVAHGDDIARARRDAIRAGVSAKPRQDVWRALAQGLADLSDDKCWYSESRNPASDKNVDHFRPKRAVEEDCTHEGYWWLAFDWHNYRYASQWCNQRRNPANGTGGGKGSRFPLLPGSLRARKEGDSHDDEQPVLLDPTDPEDWRLLTFREDGHPTPSRPEGTVEYCRAIVSIETYHLHSKQLADQRRRVAVHVERVVGEMQVLLGQLRGYIADGDPGRAIHRANKLYKIKLTELFQLIAWNAEYSAAALCYAKAMVYTVEGDQQIKREWLEEILNNRP